MTYVKDNFLSFGSLDLEFSSSLRLSVTFYSGATRQPRAPHDRAFRHRRRVRMPSACRRGRGASCALWNPFVESIGISAIGEPVPI